MKIKYSVILLLLSFLFIAPAYGMHHIRALANTIRTRSSLAVHHFHLWRDAQKNYIKIRIQHLQMQQLQDAIRRAQEQKKFDIVRNLEQSAYYLHQEAVNSTDQDKREPLDLHVSQKRNIARMHRFNFIKSIFGF